MKIFTLYFNDKHTNIEVDGVKYEKHQHEILIIVGNKHELTRMRDTMGVSYKQYGHQDGAINTYSYKYVLEENFIDFMGRVVEYYQESDHVFSIVVENDATAYVAKDYQTTVKPILDTDFLQFLKGEEYLEDFTELKDSEF